MTKIKKQNVLFIIIVLWVIAALVTPDFKIKNNLLSLFIRLPLLCFLLMLTWVLPLYAVYNDLVDNIMKNEKTSTTDLIKSLIVTMLITGLIMLFFLINGFNSISAPKGFSKVGWIFIIFGGVILCLLYFITTRIVLILGRLYLYLKDELEKRNWI